MLGASKSYSERLFRYSRIDRLDREAADRPRPAARGGRRVHARGARRDVCGDGGYPYFVQAYGKAVWDAAAGSPVTVDDVRVAAPEAEAELGVGFGSRYERATPTEREYLRAMAETAVTEAEASEPEPDSVPTAAVAAHLDRKPQSLSPARDALLKKGLIYSGERGRIAFTVPHSTVSAATAS